MILELEDHINPVQGPPVGPRPEFGHDRLLLRCSPGLSGLKRAVDRPNLICGWHLFVRVNVCTCSVPSTAVAEFNVTVSQEKGRKMFSGADLKQMFRTFCAVF